MVEQKGGGSQYSDKFKIVRGQIKPRLSYIFKSWQLAWAFLLAVLTAILVPFLAFSKLTVSFVASIGMTFAAMALGGCFATCVLALAVPGADRIERWSQSQGEIEESSEYTDLVFVIVWAAFSQFFLIAGCVIALLVGGERPVFAESASGWQRCSVWAAAIVFYYATFELLTVIKTMMTIATVIMAEETTFRGTNSE